MNPPFSWQEAGRRLYRLRGVLRLGPLTGSGRRSAQAYLLLRLILIASILLFILLPIVYMMTTSVKEPIEIRETGALLPGRGLFWLNWVRAFRNVPSLKYLFNSTVVGIASTLLTLVVAVPASYTIARFRTGGTLFPSWILGTYIAPPIVISIPVFSMLRIAGLIDSKTGLAIVHAFANLPVAVWLLDGFVRAIPREIDEAAWIDGCSRMHTLTSIIVPLMMPGLVATGLICMILSWNEFLFALILTYREVSQTFPIGISGYQGEHGLQFGEMSAAALTGIIPVYVLAFFFQRHLVEGLSRGSLR